MWTAPAANYTTDLVPTSLTNFYGNSALFTYNHINPTYDSFDITGSANVNATLPVNSAVPEPGIFALAVVGLISLRTMTRKKL